MRRTVFTITLVLLTVVGVWAQRFQSAGLYFNITDETAKTVEVTYEVKSSGSNYSSLSGVLGIPATVTYNEVEYSVTGIGEYAFRKCSALTQVTLPNSVTSIGESAFRECSALAQVNIPGSVTDIGNWAFNECAALTHITIPDGVTAIGYGTFQNCSALAQVTIGSGVTTIGEYAFYICSSLTEMTIPDNVTRIESNAFKSCSSLTEVNIGNGLASMGAGALANCESLTHFNVASGNTAYCTEDGILFNQNKTTLIQYPAGKIESAYTIPTSVTHLGTEAFYGSSRLLTLHCGMSTPPVLGSNCFRNSGITTVYIPAGTLAAYTSAWGNSYTYIEEWELTVHVETPGGLEAALDGHSPSIITKLTITGTLNETDFNLIKNNMTRLYALDISGITNTTLPDEVFAVNTTLLQVDLPSQLTAIPVWAFLRCKISSITIPNTVTSIGKEAFYKCAELTEVTIPESVTSIGDRAFANCSALTRVIWNAIHCGDFVYDSSTMTYPPFYNSPVTDFTWGEQVEHIPAFVCYKMNRLTKVSIPESVTSMGDMAFAHCTALTQVNWNAVNCGDIANNSSGSFYPPFYNTSVTHFIWGEQVVHIPAYSCYGMNRLTKMTLPESVTSIGEYAFGHCSALTEMTALGIVPPTAGDFAFEAVSREIPVYVPASALAAYQTADTWSEFIHLQAIGTTGLQTPTLPENIIINGGQLHNPQGLYVSLYDMQGRLVYSGNDTVINQPTGVYVIRCADSNCKVLF